MNKKVLLYEAPIESRSGYGDHARSILKSIYASELFDVKIIPISWGTTPLNQLNDDSEFTKRVQSDILRGPLSRPDVHIHLTIPNEFKPKGKFNIGITAGTESSIAPETFKEPLSLLDLVITPSQFTEDILYNLTDKPNYTVLFEGIDVNKFKNEPKPSGLLDDIPTDFNFLIVGSWLEGSYGEDRKDVARTIDTFCKTFTKVKHNKPGLIVKTYLAGFSIEKRDILRENIKMITDQYGDECPNVYLLFGSLTDDEMNLLYNDPKVKAMVSFTKAEGYGRPLAEFAITGKPILVSDYSGLKDFLPGENVVYLRGKLTDIHPSAMTIFFGEGSKWFTVDYNSASNKMMKVFKKYDMFLEKSKPLSEHIINNFSQEKQDEVFKSILEKLPVFDQPKFKPIQIPNGIKI